MGLSLRFGSMNIQSLSSTKLDVLIAEMRTRTIDVIALCELWHDADSVSIHRLRAEGFSVVERARPRSLGSETSLRVNHGGVAIVTAAGIRLSPVDIGSTPSTFECTAARITTGQSSCVVIVIYRTGNVTNDFFRELSSLLDQLITLPDALLLVGDVNIRLERLNDPDTIQFNETITSYGLSQHVRDFTHDRGGTLDMVCSRDDLPSPTVNVADIGISDHRLIQWSTNLHRPKPIFTSTLRRVWRTFDADVFKANLRSSPLCDPQRLSVSDVEVLASTYDSTINELLDRQVPARNVTCRLRSSCRWFDDECRIAKRLLRFVEHSTSHPEAVSAWRAQRCLYRKLLRRKRSAYWSNLVASDQSNPRRLWRSFNELLGRERANPTVSIDATQLHRHFENKVAVVRAATEGSELPSFSCAPDGCAFQTFSLITSDDVAAVIRALPDKQCAIDPLPTKHLKDNVELLSPFLCNLFNLSLTRGIFPSSFKAAYITPLLKGADLDPTDAKSYRPISNLSVISKLLERIVCKQLLTYLKESNLLPSLQSAYRQYHSTETAVLKVISDILSALDAGNLAILALLDLSAAFDSIDHSTLLQRFRVSYGIDGTVLDWITSYLSDRTQHVRFGETRSPPSSVGPIQLPQGSVLGPVFFIMYAAALQRLIERHQLTPHGYADDTQIYGSCRPADADILAQKMSTCIDEVSQWMKANRLQLNQSKTEVVWFASSRRQHQIPSDPVRVGSTYVPPASTARDLGVHLDSDISLKKHINLTVRACFAALRRIRTLRRSLPRHALLTLIRALVVSKVDYCNSVLNGLPGRQLDRLQSILNAAARIIFSARKYDHITPLLYELHWLKVKERIHFKLCVLTHRCLHGTAPDYLAEVLHRTTDIDARRRLRSADSSLLLVPTTRRSTLGDRAFSVAGPRAWNGLPRELRETESLTVFRRKLKTHLFAQSFA